MSNTIKSIIYVCFCSLWASHTYAESGVDHVTEDSRSVFLSQILYKADDPYNILAEGNNAQIEQLNRIAIGSVAIGDDPAKGWSGPLYSIMTIKKQHPSWTFFDHIDQAKSDSYDRKLIEELIKHNQPLVEYVYNTLDTKDLQHIARVMWSRIMKCSQETGDLPPRLRPDEGWKFCRGFAATGGALGMKWEDVQLIKMLD